MTTDDSIDYNRPIAEWTDVQLERFSAMQRKWLEILQLKSPQREVAEFAGKLADEILRLRAEFDELQAGIADQIGDALRRAE